MTEISGGDEERKGIGLRLFEASSDEDRRVTTRISKTVRAEMYRVTGAYARELLLCNLFLGVYHGGCLRAVCQVPSIFQLLAPGPWLGPPQLKFMPLAGKPTHGSSLNTLDASAPLNVVGRNCGNT